MRTPLAGATGWGEKLRRRSRLRGTSGGRVVLLVSEAELLVGDWAEVELELELELEGVEVAAVKAEDVEL
jgi:hypothetical protein